MPSISVDMVITSDYIETHTVSMLTTAPLYGLDTDVRILIRHKIYTRASVLKRLSSNLEYKTCK